MGVLGRSEGALNKDNSLPLPFPVSLLLQRSSFLLSPSSSGSAKRGERDWEGK